MNTEPRITVKDLEAISELAKDAQGVNDLVAIREMAAEDYGDGEATIRVEKPDGTIEEHNVTEVGRDEYAQATKGLVDAAVKKIQIDETATIDHWTIPKQ